MRASYASRWLEISAALASDAADEGQGTLLDVELRTRRQVLPRVSLGGGFGARWADSEFTQAFFGVDAAQSERSTLPIYSVDSGLNQVRAFVQATYNIDRHWLLGAEVSAARLEGDAEDSPITEDDTDNRLAVFLMHRF